MISITEKTLDDLQFPTILETIASHCVTEIGKEKALQILPFTEKTILINALMQTSEYVASYTNNNVIPNHGFDAIHHEIKFLAIQNSSLEVGSFRKITTLSETSNVLIQFFKKFDDYYPNLNKKASQIEYTKDIVKYIEEVVDKHGEVKNNASLIYSTFESKSMLFVVKSTKVLGPLYRNTTDWVIWMTSKKVLSKIVEYSPF